MTLYCTNKSTDEVREKIQLLIDSRAMAIIEFQKKIGVSGTPYYRFMKQSGVDEGSKSKVYSNTLAYFNHCKRKGVKARFNIPRAAELPKKKAKVEEDEYDELWDVSMVELDGEEDEEVEVYDTCVRRKFLLSKLSQ
jgi:hypothetical protein